MHSTINARGQQGPKLLEVALEYHRRGWSIIPIKPRTKRPACRSWKRYQAERPAEQTLRRWFGSGKDVGLAVILGEVSGDLVCRDFDVMEAYHQWAGEHPGLARTLPTVATGRPGRHVYCRGDIGHIRALRPSGAPIINLDNGELRGGGYCLLPPSRHPDGPEYTWLVPLRDGELPRVEDLAAAGFLDPTRATETTERTETTEENRGQQRETEAIARGELVAQQAGLDKELERAIIESLPKEPSTHPGPGRRNHQVFDLCRSLKAIPRLADANPNDLVPYVKIFHDLGVARGVIGTLPFEETRLDFLYGWPRVKFPKGADPMTIIFGRAKGGQLPQVALRYEQAGLRLLVALCRELQRASGDRPFFLACRTAGRLLEVDHTTAWRWLFLLQHDGVIEEVEKGSRARRRASRYQYRGD